VPPHAPHELLDQRDAGLGFEAQIEHESGPVGLP
jgi:hypothetical protein